MKRAIISKGIFRVSVSGVDVDNAQDYEFAIHESHLAAQPYFITSVPCPLSGTSGSFRDASINVPVPIFDDSHVVIVYCYLPDNAAYYPYPPSNGSSGVLQGSYAFWQSIPPDIVFVRFIVPANTFPPERAIIIMMRGEKL